MIRNGLVVAALMSITFAAPSAAGQARTSATGGRGSFSTGRPEVTRGVDDGGVRTAGPVVRRVEPEVPSPQTVAVPQPATSPTTAAASSPTATSLRSAPATPASRERFRYPPSTRPSGSARGATQRAGDADPTSANRNQSGAARTAAPASSVVSRSSAARAEAGSVQASVRRSTRYDVPRPQGGAPRYVAPGWRSGSTSHVVVVPRVVHPTVLGFAPYRRYCYRPSIGIGIYYGVDAFYPFGDIDSQYYDPPSNAALGGVRITGAPRDAQVFVDGAYVGIVDDFDGTDQHLNLEPGVHRIEIHTRGAGAVAFEVTVQQGRTITLRASAY